LDGETDAAAEEPEELLDVVQAPGAVKQAA
jgi:hypothetical protein